MATWLRDHSMAGRLTLDEFSERVETVYAARFGQELVAVREDCPTPPCRGPRRGRKATRVTLAVFSHVGRRGRLRLRRRTAAISAFADIDFDLREAQVDRPETSVIVLALFGNVDVYVPEAVNVDLGGLTIFGHSRELGAGRGPARRPYHPRPDPRMLRDHRSLEGAAARARQLQRHHPGATGSAPAAAPDQITPIQPGWGA